MIVPMIEKEAHDRETIKLLQRAQEGAHQQIDLLEVAVYKRDSTTGRTLFDVIQEGLAQLEVSFGQFRQNLREEILQMS